MTQQYWHAPWPLWWILWLALAFGSGGCGGDRSDRADIDTGEPPVAGQAVLSESLLEARVEIYSVALLDAAPVAVTTIGAALAGGFKIPADIISADQLYVVIVGAPRGWRSRGRPSSENTWITACAWPGCWTGRAGPWRSTDPARPWRSGGCR